MICLKCSVVVVHLPSSKAQSRHLFSSPHFSAKSLGREFVNGPKYFHTLKPSQQRSCWPWPWGLLAEVEEVFHTSTKMINANCLSHLSILKAVSVKLYYFSKSSAFLTCKSRPQQGHSRTEFEQPCCQTAYLASSVLQSALGICIFLSLLQWRGRYLRFMKYLKKT